MCFDPRKDGRAIWETIHLLAANAETPEQIAAFVQFIVSLPILYPCKKCRLHTAEFIKKNPIINYLESSQLLLYWTWIFHESVNQKLNKPLAQRLTWDQTRNKYMAECEDYSRPETNHPKNLSSSSNNSEEKTSSSCGECELDQDENLNTPYSVPVYDIPKLKEKSKPKRIYSYANEK